MLQVLEGKMIFTFGLYKVLTKLNINKSLISIGALQFYWVWQHCQNTTGAASSNNVEVGNKLSNEFLLYRDLVGEQ